MNMMMIQLLGVCIDRIMSSVDNIAQDTSQDTSLDTATIIITKLPLYTPTAADIHFSPLLYIVIRLLISS